MGIYENISSVDSLRSAWLKVRDKGSAGGIDRISVDMFENKAEANLTELAADMAAFKYIPEPYQEVKIPKDDKEFRSLSLPTVRDKIVQQAVKDQIEPIFEALFLDLNYAYRQGKGAVKAISRVTHMLQTEQRGWITLCDIDSYFDNLSHDLLFKRLAEKIPDERLLTLIRLWVKMGKVDAHMRWHDSVKGIPQGGILSPLLSNFYLHPFDAFMTGKQFGLVRYADDFVILSHTEGEARRALKEAKHFLQAQLQLSLNPDYAVINLAEGFDFLGISFRGETRSVSLAKKEKLRERIAEAAGLDKDKSLKQFCEVMDGIGRYYGKLISQELLEELDEWAEERLKEELKTAYCGGLFTARSEIKVVLRDIVFLSAKYMTFRQRAIKEITAYCRKARPEKLPEDIAVVPKSDPIKTRKREYQKLEAEGFELLVTTPGSFIGKTKRGIIIKQKGIKKHEASLLNLKNISILARGVTISSNVIHHCADNNIPIFFMDDNFKPYAKLYSCNSFDAATGIAQLKAYTNGKAQSLAKTFVSGKISNQINLAKYWNKYRKGCDEDYAAAYKEKITVMERLAAEAAEVEAPDIETLRGRLLSIEGRAAELYWDLVEAVLNEDVDFEGRVRRGATDLVNCLLNYGYGILYSRIWDALHREGLHPGISYLHTFQEGKPTLTYDLIEEFRQQAVDRTIFPLITRGEELEVENGRLSEETRKRVAVKVIERINTVETFRGKQMRLYEIMRHQAKALSDFLMDRTDRYRPYRAKW